MSFAFGSFTLGAALLFSAFKNQTLISLILGEPGKSIASQGESHPSAAQVAAAQAGGTVPLATVGSGGYANPFGSGATSGRIDEGKDVGGTGVIKAIGNCKIIKVGGWGWPCEPPGKGVLYQLLDGSAKGRYVYVFEGIKPAVRAGQRVGAGGVIGHLIPGTSCGIEMGWADANGVPLAHSEYSEGKETRYGKSFAQFLKQLGF